MGCTSSEVAEGANGQPTYVLGNTGKGPLVLTITPDKVADTRPKVNIPRFCNGLLINVHQGYITGGIEEMTEFQDAKKVFNPHDKLKIFEGTLTKSFSKVDLSALKAGKVDALTKLPDMANVRYAHCSTILNGKLYVIGGRQYGQEDNALLSACQRYNFDSKRWQTVPPLHKGRSSATCVTYRQTIYVFGGYTGKNRRTRCIQCYSQGSEGWKILPVKLHVGIEGATCVPYSKGCFYIFGGKTNVSLTNQVVMCNLEQLTLSYRNPMKQKRSFSKNIQLKETVYMIGGSTQSIEAYNMDHQETQQISQPNFLQFCTSKELHSFAQMQYPLKVRQNNERDKVDGSAAKIFIVGNAKKPFMHVIDMKTEKVSKKGQPMGLDFFEFRTTLRVNDEYVFLMGGIDSSYTKVTRRASSLHLPTEKVKVLPKMIHHRYGFPAVVKGSYAYVFGGRKLGHDQEAIMNECQRFSFEKEKWEAIPPMKIRRHSSFTIVLNNLIAVVGGYKGNNVLSSDIEVFSDTQNKWFEVERKFGLAIQSMTVVQHRSHIFLFGGRTDEGDVSKVFKLDIQFKGQAKIQKGVRMNLDPVGSMSQPGSSLKIAVRDDGKALIFCHKSHYVQLYDLQTHQTVKQGTKLNEKLTDLDNSDIKTYTFCY